MTISRRQVLGALGSSVIATGAGACARTSERQATAPAPTQAQAVAPTAAPAANEFRLVFGGLQLFAIEPSLNRVTVVMPHAAPNITNHTAQLAIMGGTLAPASKKLMSSMPSQFGIDTHALLLDGYSVAVDGGMAKPLTFDDSAARTVQPGSADDWKSLRHIPDFALLHPHAKLKSGWNTTLAKSVVEITGGELMALPGSMSAPSNSVFKGQYYTQMATLRVPTSGTVKLTLTPLPGSKNKQPGVIEVIVDSTGPMVGFLGFAPEYKQTTDHGKSIEGLFDHLSPGAAMLPMPPQKKQPSITVSGNFAGSLFQPLFKMLTDGSPWCPPFSFRL